MLQATGCQLLPWCKAALRDVKVAVDTLIIIIICIIKKKKFFYNNRDSKVTLSHIGPGMKYNMYDKHKL
jgi:hypothetical protein